MPRFKYKARKLTGEETTDTVEADSSGALAKRLSGMGLIPVKISEDAETQQSSRVVFERVSSSDVIMFTRQLVTLYRAGLPFLASLDAIVSQTSNPALQRVLTEVRTDVQGGTLLSAALAKHPKVFSEVYVSTVLAGETGGVLDEVLDRLVTLLETEKGTKDTLKAALRYPVMVIGAMLIAGMVIVTFVIPTFAKMFARGGHALPLPTKILILINQVRQDYWHVCLVLLAGLVAGAIWYLRTPEGRMRFDSLILKIPLLGRIITQASMARLAHIFGTLSKSGLPILKELAVIARTIGNRRIASQLEQVRVSVQEGSSLANSMEPHDTFPPLIKHMIAVGERTGAMADMMQAVGDHYDRETKAAIARLVAAIEPLITVVLGAGLLFLALAVFLPMWDMMKVMGQ